MLKEPINEVNKEKEIKISLPSEEYQYKFKAPIDNSDWDLLTERVIAAFELGDYQVVYKKNKTIHDKYYDTEYLDFYRSNYSFRLRKENNASQLNIKSAAKKTDGVYIRDEHCFVITIDELDILNKDGIAPKSVQDLALYNELISKKIINTIDVNNTRVAFGMKKDDIEYELCVDSYTFTGVHPRIEGKLSERQFEIEIEAISKSAMDNIEELGRKITKTINATASKTTKYQSAILYFKLEHSSHLSNVWTFLKNNKSFALVLALAGLFIGLFAWFFPISWGNSK